MTRMAKILGAAALALAAGCGGNSSNNDPPVDGNLQISAASDTDKMNLCNWFTGMVGGYGTTATCSLAFLKPPPSEAACVADFPSCAVQVSTFEACVRTVIAAQETCTQASMAMAQQDPNCVTVGTAGCFN
jgi:hypothetical protein